MHYVDWSGGNGQPGHLLYDPFEEEALLYAHGSHHICPEMRKALQGVFLIAEQKKRIEESTKVSDSHTDEVKTEVIILLLIKDIYVVNSHTFYKLWQDYLARYINVLILCQNTFC